MAMKNKKLLILLSYLIFIVAACNNNSYTPPNVAFTMDESMLPAYEKDIDHKGILNTIQRNQEEAFMDGKKIYNSNCINCHGTPKQEGSLPTAFKYWKDQFKVGKDPYAIYQTLTRGYGGMPPQTALTPTEKYNVIQYIREEFILKQNKAAYFNIDSNYLASLPVGKSKGPSSIKKEGWLEMDYGNFLINTYELVEANAKPREISGAPSPLKDENLVNANFAYKGIGVRLDEGPGGIAAGKAWMIFDHDLMRIAGAWTGKGFIDWEGILFNGQHNISPRTIGELQYATPVSPSWANPANGSFVDPRFKAVDNRRFGPLPRNWAQYKGLYHYQDKLIISYSVGNSSVLEKLSLEGTTEMPILALKINRFN